MKVLGQNDLMWFTFKGLPGCSVGRASGKPVGGSRGRLGEVVLARVRRSGAAERGWDSGSRVDGRAHVILRWAECGVC